MKGLAAAAVAFFELDRRDAWSYPLAMVNRLVSTFALVFVMFFVGRTIETSAVDEAAGGDLFLFAVTGYAVLGLLGASMSAYASQLRSYQLAGLLEVCLMTRTPMWQLLLAMPSYALVNAFVRTAVLVTAQLLCQQTIGRLADQSE